MSKIKTPEELIYASRDEDVTADLIVDLMTTYHAQFATLPVEVTERVETEYNYEDCPHEGPIEKRLSRLKVDKFRRAAHFGYSLRTKIDWKKLGKEFTDWYYTESEKCGHSLPAYEIIDFLKTQLKDL